MLTQGASCWLGNYDICKFGLPGQGCFGVNTQRTHRHYYQTSLTTRFFSREGFGGKCRYAAGQARIQKVKILSVQDAYSWANWQGRCRLSTVGFNHSRTDTSTPQTAGPQAVCLTESAVMAARSHTRRKLMLVRV